MLADRRLVVSGLVAKSLVASGRSVLDEAARAPGLEHARAWHSPSWTDDYDNAKRAMDGHIAELTDELANRPCVK